MTPTYAKKLEEIVSEMNLALQSGKVLIADTEYSQWFTFLKQVYPESALVTVSKSPAPEHKSISEDVVHQSLVYELKVYDDIHEIMMLAEMQGYPTWFVQPHYIGLTVILKYEQGILTNITVENNGSLEQLELRTLNGIPQHIPEFTGNVKGVLHMSREEYVKQGTVYSETAQVAVYEAYESEYAKLSLKAVDVDSRTSFREKMSQLEQCGFTIAEYVLFPTSRLSTISSSKLETFFKSYLNKAHADGLWVDGLVIISDTHLVTTDDGISSSRVLYKSSLEPPA